MTVRSNRPVAWTRVALSTLSGLLAVVFLVAAAMKFAAVDFETRNFAHFGYAPWFMMLIGLAEFAGSVALLFRETRAIAACGLAVIMVGAFASHVHAGDGLGMATPSLVLLFLLVVVAYAERIALRQWMPAAA